MPSKTYGRNRATSIFRFFHLTSISTTAAGVGHLNGLLLTVQ